MFSKLREPFGTAGLVVAVIALVLALGGGAWALSASVSSGKHRHAAEAKRHGNPLRGPRGARGSRGLQGPEGPEGPEGPPGINGRNGTDGKAGIPGADGLPAPGVLSGEEPEGENCEQGGYWFEAEEGGERNYVCNGAGGSGGGGGGVQTELAPGETESGVWSFEGRNGSIPWVTINFPFRLPEGTKGSFNSEHCPGTSAEPEPEPGYWCLYTANSANSFITGVPVSSQSGVILEFALSDESEPGFAYGTWAATAALEEEP